MHLAGGGQPDADLRPSLGREFFEEIIRDNLDLGRPDRVQSIFDSGGGEENSRRVSDGRKELSGTPNDFGLNKGLANLPDWQKIGRQINRRLLEVERASHNSGLSGDGIQRVVQPAVTEDGKKAPGLKFGQPPVMALLLALTMFHYLIDGFRNHDLRQQVADLLGMTLTEYTPHPMTYDLRRLRLKGLAYRPPKTNRHFVTRYGWKVARLFSRLDARVFRPPMAMFTGRLRKLTLSDRSQLH